MSKRTHESTLLDSVKKLKSTDPILLTTQLLVELEEKGYVVVPNVLDEEICKQYQQKFWDWYETCNSNIKRTDPDTWVKGKWPVVSHEVPQHPHISHANFVWEARQEANIIQVFSELWGTSELLVGFCRASLIRPKRFFKRAIRPWFHVDQSSLKRGRVCVQGMINLESTESEDGGLMIIPRSHMLFNRFFDEHELKIKADWFKYTDVQLAWFKAQNERCVPTFVTAPIGSMILWDSRTIHCNRSPTAKQPDGDKCRYAIYICMTPASFCIGDKNKQKKADAFEHDPGTYHWPHEITKFQHKPRFCKEDLTIYTQPPRATAGSLTPIGRKLAGLESY